MKQRHIANRGTVELNRDELKNVTGGDDVVQYLKCVSATLTSSGGAIRSFLLGVTIFGMARIAGVMAGCASN